MRESIRGSGSDTGARLLYGCVFVAVGLVVYFAGVAALMVVVAAQGGGVSCDGGDCVPVARAANDAAPWSMIGWIGVSLAVAGLVTRRVASLRPRRA